MECSKSSSKREVHSDKCLPQEIRKISNKQLNFTPQGSRKEKMKPRAKRRKEITKIREEINEKETNKTIEEINETKSLF